jgi:hypothetical protein
MLPVRADVAPTPVIGSDPIVTVLALGFLAVAMISVTVLAILIIRRRR